MRFATGDARTCAAPATVNKRRRTATGRPDSHCACIGRWDGPSWSPETGQTGEAGFMPRFCVRRRAGTLAGANSKTEHPMNFAASTRGAPAMKPLALACAIVLSFSTSGVFAQDGGSNRITDEQNVHPGGSHQLCRRIVVGGQHGDRGAGLLELAESLQCDRGGRRD